GLSDGGAFVTPSGNGVRFNFAADPEAQPAAVGGPIRSADPFANASGVFNSMMPASSTKSAISSSSRTDDSFAALGYAAGPTKAPPRIVEPREWYAWAEVRGATLDRWGSATALALPNATVLYGNQ